MAQIPESHEARWARYLKMASQAKTSAATARTKETRAAYLELAESWAALARGLEFQDQDLALLDEPSMTGRKETLVDKNCGFETATLSPDASCEQTTRLVRSRFG